MSSVLLSLCLGMFAVAQSLTSLIHDCIEISSSDISSGGVDICNSRSSENEWYMIGCESVMADNGLIYMGGKYGHEVNPVEHMRMRVREQRQLLDKVTYCFQSVT